MIKSMDLENFMGVQAAVYNFKDSASIISGRNGIGKSTALNALNWILTDSLYTDKPGTGEKDIDSIVPRDHEKGEHTSVTIMFDSGKSFTKTYKVGFDKESGKANKHTTDVAINGVKVRTLKEFYDELYEELKFKPSFKALGADEPRLFTDPLFALLKLDYKELRELLVSMGCSVEDEDLFNNGFADIKALKAISGGNWPRFRTGLKDTIKTLNKNAADKEAQLDLFKALPEFNQDEYNELDNQKQDLIIKKNNLLKGQVNEQTLVLKEHKQDLEHVLALKKQKKASEIQSEIKALEDEKMQYQRDLIQAKENASNELLLKKDSLQSQLRSKQSEINTLNNSISSLNSNIKNYKQMGNTAWDEKTRLLEAVAAVEARQFQGYVTCPTCGEIFAPNPDDLARFESSKADEILSIKKNINFQASVVSEMQENITSTDKKVKDAEAALQYANEELAKLNHDIADIESKLAEIKPEELIPNPTSVINNKLILERSSLENIDNQFIKEQEEIDHVQLQIDILTKGDDEARAKLLEEANTIQASIDELTTKLDELSVIKVDNQRKAKISGELESVKHKVNDEEHKLERINEFIRTKIKMINDLAKAKTGFNFVMLEENLSGGLNEVCYPLIDGIPYMKINNSAKIYWGVKFIEKCKEIAVNEFGVPRNQFPILADDLEKVDDINKLKTLTTEQLVCTRVSNSTEIEIL